MRRKNQYLKWRIDPKTSCTDVISLSPKKKEKNNIINEVNPQFTVTLFISPSDGMVNVFVLETKFWGFESLLGYSIFFFFLPKS